MKRFYIFLLDSTSSPQVAPLEVSRLRRLPFRYLRKGLLTGLVFAAVFLACGGLAQKAQAAHSFGVSAQNNTLQLNPSTFSFTANSTSTVLILHIMNNGTTARTGGAPTYGGVSMTQLDSTRSAVESTIEVWYLLGPPTGANTMSIPNVGLLTLDTLTATANAASGFTSALDVVTGKTNQTTANPTSTITTTVNGDFITSFSGHGAAAPGTGNKTQYGGVWGFDSGAFSYMAMYELQASLGATTHQFTVAADDWSMILASFKQVAIVVTTTLGGGTNPGDATIAPGGAATEVDSFTFQTSAGTDNILSVTTTLAVNTTSSISKVEITSDNGSTVYGSSTDPTANSFSIATTLNGGLIASTTSQQFKIRITPKSHTNMPAVPGSTYTVTSTITAWNGTNTHAGSDATSSVLTIDNESPANVTGTSTTPGSQQVKIDWTNPVDSDFSNVIVVKSTSTPNNGTPTEGQTYNVSDSLGNGTVIYNSNDASTTATGLVNSITYYFKIWTKDTSGNYSQNGVEVSDTPTAAALSISGTCVQWDMSTACGTSDIIAVAVNGNLQAQSTSTAGSWIISGLTQPTAGDVLTVFVSSTVANNRAIAITKYNSGLTLSGVNLIQRTLVIGGGSTAQTITNASSSVFDYSASSNNPNIFFDVSGANNDLNVDILNAYPDERLLVRAGHTYQPNPTGAQAVITSQNFYASSTATTTANGTIWRLSGSFENLGTFDSGTSTIEFSGASANIYNPSGTFYNLTASSTATATATSSFIVASTLNVVGTLSINSGQTVTASSTLTLSGTISGAGTLKYISGTTFPTGGTISAPVLFDTTNTIQTIPQRAFGNVTFENNGTSARTITLAMAASQTITFGTMTLQSTGSGGVTLTGATNNPNITIAGDFSIISGGGTKSITTGSGIWDVSGNFNLTNIGTFTASNGNTLKMSGTGTLTSNNQTLQNLEINSSGVVTLVAAATTTVAGNLTLAGSGTPVVTNTTIFMSSTSATIAGGGKALNNLTIDPATAGTITLNTSDLTVSGILNVATGDTLSIAAGRTLTHSGATLTLPTNATISGSGRLTYRSTTAFPTTGNASSTLRFDATAGNQIISQRIYGGLVEIDNSGATASRTVTLGTAGSQTISFSSDLTILSSGAGGVLLTGSTYSPIVNVTGSSTITSGGGSKDITTGSGIWTISGNFNLTNVGVFTATAGNTFVLNGSSKTLTTAGQTFTNLDFTGATTPTISGNATSTGNVTLVSGMTLTNVTLKMTGQNKNLVGAGNTLPNLTIDGTAASTTIATSDLIVSGTLTLGTDDILAIAASRTLTAQGTAVLPAGGMITGAGTLVYTGSANFPTTGTLSPTTMRFDSTANDQSIPNRTFSSSAVEIENSGTTSRTTTLGTATSQTITFGNLTIQSTGSGGVTVTGATYNPAIALSSLAISGANSKVLTTGSGNWTVSGNFNLSNITTFTASAGNTLVMSGSGTLTSNNQTLKNVNLSGAITLANATHLINGNLNLTGGTITAGSSEITMTSSSASLIGAGQTLNNLTASSTGTITLQTSDLTVGGVLTVATSTTLSIDSGRILTASSTLSLNGTISGAGRLIYRSSTVFPANGTISSILRFDATNGDQTMSARAYGGQIELVNTGGTNRTIIMAAGANYNLSSHLLIFASSTGNITLDGATNNASTTINGNLIYSGSGDGSEIVTASSNNWTITGALNISDGSFTAPSGNLNLAGNYTNTGGAFTHNSGTVILNGSAQQTLSGILNGSSAFNVLTITNNSGNEATPSIVFNATTTAATSTIAVGTSTVQFNASSTFAFTNINWNGQATSSRIKLRSSISTSTRWFLNVSPGGSQTVTYVDAKDSDASSNAEISAGDGTNLDSGGNVNWIFSVISPNVSSTIDEIFEYNQATTTVAAINIQSGAGSPKGRIASSTDIRVRIPDGFNALWDNIIASITCSAGDSCAKISTTSVTYESSNKVAVIDVLQNFSNGDWVQISGLKMGGFSAVNSATTTYRLRVDGSASQDAATDTKTKTIKGKITQSEHSAGQPENKFNIDATSLTAAGLFRFKLVPAGENITVTTTTINISNIIGFGSSDITNAKLYQDVDNDGVFDTGEPQLGVNGTSTITAATGTIVFGGTWTATTTTNIILQADVSSINDGDTITFSLPSSNISVKGASTTESMAPYGFSSNKAHGKSVKAKGGGIIEQPPAAPPVGGGTPGGGTIEQPPTATSTPGGEPGGGQGGSAFAPQTIQLLASIVSLTSNLVNELLNFIRRQLVEGLLKFI